MNTICVLASSIQKNCLLSRLVTRCFEADAHSVIATGTRFSLRLFLNCLCIVGVGSSLSLMAEEFTHKEAYVIAPQLVDKKIQLESFCLGPRGVLWMGCRVIGENGASDSGHMMVYDPTGLLFNSFPIPIVPEAINFSPKSWLYVASSEKIARVSLDGRMEVDLNSERLYETKPLAKLAQSGRPSIAALEDAVFVAYPQSSDGKYRVFRLSPDLSIEAEIISDIECCTRQLDIQTDGKSLLIAEAAQGKISFFDRTGKKVKSFGKRSSDDSSGFAGDCNPLAVRALSDVQVITGEIGSGALKKFNHDGTLVSHMANVKLPADCRRIAIAHDDERNWYYMMNAAAGNVSVLLPADEILDEPVK
jgi:hypothetical protein